MIDLLATQAKSTDGSTQEPLQPWVARGVCVRTLHPGHVGEDSQSTQSHLPGVLAWVSLSSRTPPM